VLSFDAGFSALSSDEAGLSSDVDLSWAAGLPWVSDFSSESEEVLVVGLAAFSELEVESESEVDYFYAVEVSGVLGDGGEGLGWEAVAVVSVSSSIVEAIWDYVLEGAVVFEEADVSSLDVWAWLAGDSASLGLSPGLYIWTYP